MIEQSDTTNLQSLRGVGPYGPYGPEARIRNPKLSHFYLAVAPIAVARSGSAFFREPFSNIAPRIPRGGKIIYNPTINVPIIDTITTISMKAQSNIPSTILMNIIPPIVIAIVIKKFLGFLNRIKQYPISLNGKSILFSGDFYRSVSMILVTVLIIRI